MEPTREEEETQSDAVPQARIFSAKVRADVRYCPDAYYTIAFDPHASSLGHSRAPRPGPWPGGESPGALLLPVVHAAHTRLRLQRIELRR